MAPIIIIGTGLAGYATARELRKHDTATPLILISRGSADYYYKPDISEALSKGNTPDGLIKKSAGEMAAELSAEIRAHSEVMAIEAPACEVCLGHERLAYKKLVLANGAESISPPLASDSADNVHKINNIADYIAFRPVLDAAKRVIVLGAGLIGCEFSNDLITHGICVDCVDPIAWPLQRFLPAACGEVVRDELAAAGVNWHLGRTTVAIQRNLDSSLCVKLDNGHTLDADAVLSAVGVRPATGLARAAGLTVNHGVVVDRELRTSDPHIYALGDCAEVDGLFRPFVAPLMQAARALGKTLAGMPTRVRYPALPIIVKTPACPTIIYPPIDQEGVWEINGEPPNLVARFLVSGEKLSGFALTGTAIKQRSHFIKVATPMLDGL